MAHSSEIVRFDHIQDKGLRTIIRAALDEMQSLLETTPCLSSVSIADQLNAIKKAAFDQMYKIGRETTSRDISEEVLKAIRALQDAFGQIIAAITPMDNIRYCLADIWLRELGRD